MCVFFGGDREDQSFSTFKRGAGVTTGGLFFFFHFCKHIYFGLQKGSPSCNSSAPQGVLVVVVWGGGLQVRVLKKSTTTFNIGVIWFQTAPVDVCVLVNRQEGFHILGEALHSPAVSFCLTLCFSQLSSVMFSSCEMSHFAARGFPQDTRTLTFSFFFKAPQTTDEIRNKILI